MRGTASIASLTGRPTRLAWSRDSTSAARNCSCRYFPVQGLPRSRRVAAARQSIHTTGRPLSSPASPGSPGPSNSNGAGLSGSSSGASQSQPVDIRARQRKQTRQREWTAVAVAGGVATAGAWYLWASRRASKSSASTNASPTQSTTSRVFSLAAHPTPVSFSIPVRGPEGLTSRIITALTPAEVERRLRLNECSTVLCDRGGAVDPTSTSSQTSADPPACSIARYDTNFVASNDPIEDRHAEAVVRRDTQIAGQGTAAANGDFGSLGFFTIMDGHAGWYTSELLSKQLIAAVAAELDAVFRASGPYASIAASKAALPAKAWRALFGPSLASEAGVANDPALDADPRIIAGALQAAFVRLDKHIVDTPVRLLRQYEVARAASLKSGAVDDLGSAPAGSSAVQPQRSLSALAGSLFGMAGGLGPKAEPSPEADGAAALRKAGYEALLPAASGSCALLTYVDGARGDVYVACTGDSRAVAGWWDEKAQKWEIEALSTDQTGRNLAEVKRMQSEHPTSEADHVIQRGRVLGGLEPTRAFGDARYKWSRDLQQALTSSLIPGGGGFTSIRAPPRGLQTPPYVTAKPEVTWRKASQNQGNKRLKWIVMATDGLWDMLPTEDVGGLVAAHLDGAKGQLTASALQNRLSAGGSKSMDNATHSAAAASKGNNGHPLNRTKEAQYVFEDSNLATHLIKNALGGANRDRVAGLLAIPAPDSRRFRDDITVNVILFDTPKLSPAEPSAQTDLPPAASSHSPQEPRAKL
ncbi:protein serine/threonine phosphatase 2C [Ceraceosorus guamensis]|uniref:Protein serine/threonine phosphatase 2C n=1 Tax=Ceraceosorus guamensis TaxID=1522189 RepID=A0A316VZQ8_9BASI|nr:protein serine/threonine phosphatase 2C [Ceraceosorus guamensis]PWN42962.1 protein serine/threonine phosphatase 2C [Ceraceosorus guamensis]